MCTRAFRKFILIKDLLRILKEADSAPISTRKVFSESSSMLWGFIEGVTSRDNIRIVLGELETDKGSYIGVNRGCFSS